MRNGLRSCFLSLAIAGGLVLPCALRSADCDADGVPDLEEIEGGAPDCDRNGIPDACDLVQGPFGVTPSGIIPFAPFIADLDGSDLDGDGDTDLVASSANAVDILLRGSGLEFSTRRLSVDCNSLRAADLDGDGDRDLAAASMQMITLWNDGAAGFPTSEVWGGDLQHVSVAPADLDGDGDLDLVSIAANQPSVSVLLNSGNGTFPSQAIIGARHFPGLLAVADLDGDGDSDIATNSQSGPELIVFTNTDGRGAFGIETGVELDFLPTRIGAAQLDGSGPEELIAFGAIPARFCILRNDGAELQRSCRTSASDVAWFHHAADFDSDGIIDLLVLEAAAVCPVSHATLHVGLGGGGLRRPLRADIGDGSSPAILRDMDGDGRGEIVLAKAPREVDRSILVLQLGKGPPHPDCNVNGIPDGCEIGDSDLDFNSRLDSCDIRDGRPDCDGNGVPDSQDPDCDHNGLPDACDLAIGNLEDANGDGFPDACEPPSEPFEDCNGNLVSDDMDVASGSSGDCNGNGVPDECDIRRFAAEPRNRLYPYRLVTSVALADLDGSGDADLAMLASPDFNGSEPRRTSLFVHRNARGSWAPALEYPAGPLPVQVLAGDLDGNGTQDLLSLSLEAPCLAPGFIAAHTNRGTGAMGKPRILAWGLQPTRFAREDLDGDADLDVIVAGEDARDALFVFLNDGAGNFQRAAELDVDLPRRPSDLVAADLDRDGDADIAVAIARTVVPFSNAGDGRLVPGTPAATSFAAARIAAADLEGHGVPDIVVAPGPVSANAIFVLENDGRGALGPERTIPAPVAAKAVLAFDGDGDGKDDLAIAGPVFVPGNTPDAEQLHHLRSLGGRAFASPVWLDRNLWVMDLSTGDIDADGDLDLAVADLARNAVRFYTNAGRQGFDPGSRHPAREGIMALIGGDLDGDTFDEVLAASTFTRTVTEIPGAGAGGSGGRPLALEFNPFALASGDLDGDGDGDLIPAGDFAVQAFLREPDGSYVSTRATVLSSPAMHVVASDLDGDGDLDVATANSLGSGFNDNASVLANDGTGILGTPRNFGIGIRPQALCAADLDGDGDADLATSNSIFDAGFSILWNQGAGRFDRAETRPAPEMRGLFATDVDGDGLLDLLGASSDAVNILENRGAGGFAERSLSVRGEGWALNGDRYGFAGGDIDGDRDVDLALTDHDEIHLLENREGLFPARPEIQTTHVSDGSGASGSSDEPSLLLALPDVNGDGLLDFAFAAPGGNEVLILRNRGQSSRDLDGNGVPDECRPPGAPFRRGEVNMDASTDMSDAIALLRWLFADGPGIPCIEAADGNDDGRADLSDAVWLLRYLFLGAAPPYEPFAACGADPTPDALGCLSFPGCEV